LHFAEEFIYDGGAVELLRKSLDREKHSSCTGLPIFPLRQIVALAFEIMAQKGDVFYPTIKEVTDLYSQQDIERI